RALEMASISGVDAEVGGKLHRAAYAFRDIAERSISKDRSIQGREEVISVRHHRPEILLDQFRVILHRLGKGAEDNPQLRELLLRGGRHGNAVNDRIDRDASEPFLFRQANTPLLERIQ